MNENDGEIQRQTAAGERAPNVEEPGVLPELVALAEANRSLRNWPPDAIKKAEALLSEVLFGRASAPDTVRGAMGLVQDLPVVAVESATASHWQALNQERKDHFLSELTKNNSSKWLTRQAAIAEKIARADQQAAAQIIHSFVSGGKAGKDGEGFWPNLSKEKKELLQSRFLLSEDGWVDFKVDDERVARSLLAAFVEAAADSQVVKKVKSKRTLYDFARWAATAQKRLGAEEPARAEIRSRVTELANQLPTDEWKRAIYAILDADGGYASQEAVATEHESPTAPTVRQSADAGQPERLGATGVSNPLPLPATQQTPTTEQARDPTTLAKVLAERSREGASRWRSAVDSFANELSAAQEIASLAERLTAAVANLEREKSELEAELYQTRKRNEGLKSDNAAREARLSAALDELEKAQAAAESLSTQLEEVRSELERERAARSDERRTLEEDAGRRVEVKLNGLKWKLAESLRPVFDNKRSTDGQEPSPRLAEFLRHWFDELEARLAAAGVKLGSDG
ncbi:MAG TPA: hypothetical protein VN256_06070 [Pyrinomonadaceae bacterium]|nr:hypothetical protein [Pyrinomonadaceae bacterium]